jgi:hypothetical protein
LVPLRRVLLAALVVFTLAATAFVWRWATYPSDRTPEGAYLRIVRAVNRDRPEEFFAYLETPAQHACFTIGEYRGKARERVLAAYPEPERSRLAGQHASIAEARDGPAVFAVLATERGFVDRLRRDLSGIAHVHVEGERATVETARGSRYPFRVRENGIWGLTSFTGALVSEAEKAARDYEVITRAAADHERVRGVRGK